MKKKKEKNSSVTCSPVVPAYSSQTGTGGVLYSIPAILQPTIMKIGNTGLITDKWFRNQLLSRKEFHVEQIKQFHTCL